MRIVSLLPSITEIVCALGLEQNLVGRSHECDYPPSVQALPACTAPKYQADGTSYEINQQVKAMVQEGLSVYRVDADLLASLGPDLILTQEHCEACAASYSDVRQAVKDTLDDEVDVLSVSPGSLDEVFLSIQHIAEVLGTDMEGERLIKKMTDDLNKIQGKTDQLPSPEVICIEWIDPLMASGNWVPELIHIAGGTSRLAAAGDPSPWIKWEDVLSCDPDLLLVSPCGYSLTKTAEEMERLISKPGWHKLQAVQNDRVFLMEGHHYFHRPGPRLVDSTHILAEIFHPGIFGPTHQNSGWMKFFEL